VTRVYLLGVYDEAPKAAAAATAIRAARLGEVTAYAPAPNHQIDAALGPGVSPVRVFTLLGGILGCVLGFALPIYTALDLPLITGGKPIVSIPPFVVIAFELTILLASLGAIAGFLVLSGLPLLRSGPPYDPRFSEDRWGVGIDCAADQADAVRARLNEAGAEEVRRAKP
jgi:molybdopterin-containing oxidoreductase family membrane subunit